MGGAASSGVARLPASKGNMCGPSTNACASQVSACATTSAYLRTLCTRCLQLRPLLQFLLLQLVLLLYLQPRRIPILRLARHPWSRSSYVLSLVFHCSCVPVPGALAAGPLTMRMSRMLKAALTTP